jgi:HlyD family secretion protein
MQVDAAVDDADIGRLRHGLPATFTVDAFPGQVFRGEIVQIRQAPQVIQNVVTYTAVIAVSNPERILMPGMTANVRVQVERRESVLRVPNAALRFRPPGDPGPGPRPDLKAGSVGAGSPARVFVSGKDGTPRAVPIVVGVTDGTNSEVREGDLEPGQSVIIGELAARPSPGPGSPPRL